jgi:hypothetical protein
MIAPGSPGLSRPQRVTKPASASPPPGSAGASSTGAGVDRGALVRAGRGKRGRFGNIAVAPAAFVALAALLALGRRPSGARPLLLRDTAGVRTGGGLLGRLSGRLRGLFERLKGGLAGGAVGLQMKNGFNVGSRHGIAHWVASAPPDSGRFRGDLPSPSAGPSAGCRENRRPPFFFEPSAQAFFGSSRQRLGRRSLHVPRSAQPHAELPAGFLTLAPVFDTTLV